MIEGVAFFVGAWLTPYVFTQDKHIPGWVTAFWVTAWALAWTIVYVI